MTPESNATRIELSFDKARRGRTPVKARMGGKTIYTDPVRLDDAADRQRWAEALCDGKRLSGDFVPEVLAALEAGANAAADSRTAREADGAGIDDFPAAGGTSEVVAGTDVAEALADNAGAAHGADNAGPAGRSGTPGASGGQSGNALAGQSPTVRIDEPFHHIVRVAVETLAARDPDIYQRDNKLVRIVEGPVELRGGVGDAVMLPQIESCEIAHVRERLSAVLTFMRPTPRGGMVPCHPPSDIAEAVAVRKHYPNVRPILGVVTAPVLRPDGTILQRAGYDRATGLFYRPTVEVPPIPDNPTRDDAVAAWSVLAEAVHDFPFLGGGDPGAPKPSPHRSAWLAALQSVLARPAFRQPAPLHLFEANIRRSGKSKLADIVSIISTGKTAPRQTYVHNEEEFDKRIVSTALSGVHVALLDNVNGPFGNSKLDAVLTASPDYSSRRLGTNEMVTVPVGWTYLATSNNAEIAGDLIGRLSLCRIECLGEHPEDRSGFRHPDLLRWVEANRGRLLAAALTMLRAYIAAGRPDVGLRTWGGFEEWSTLVRAPIVWAGLPDPRDTVVEVRKTADSGVSALGGLLAALAKAYPTGTFSAGDVIRLAKSAQVREDDREDDTRELPAIAQERAATAASVLRALLEFAEGNGGSLPSAKSLGRRFKGFRRRVVGGRFLDEDGEDRDGSLKWRVRSHNDTASQGLTGLRGLAVAYAGEKSPPCPIPAGMRAAANPANPTNPAADTTTVDEITDGDFHPDGNGEDRL